MASVIPIVDSASGIVIQYMTIFLNAFLPTVHFDIGTVPEDMRRLGIKRYYETSIYGSEMERLAIPAYFRMNINDIELFTADVDFVFVDKRYQVFRGRPQMKKQKSSKKFKLLMDDTRCKEGFMRLWTDDEKLFVIPKWFESANIPDLSCSRVRQGPAMTNKIKIINIIRTYNMSKLPQHLNHSIDNVYAIRFEQWPEAADEWKIRKRISDWPTAELVAELTRDGCLLVQKAHPESSYPEVEWRLSFSAVERTLARNLTSVQRKCYVLFKLAVSLVLKIDKLAINQQTLSTYHLKTVMLWVYETIPVLEFTEINVGKRYLDLVDRLIDFVEDGVLPNYFIRQNNMIGHIQFRNQQAILRNLYTLRRYPLQPLIQFEKEYCFLFSYQDYWETVHTVFTELVEQPVYDGVSIRTKIAQGLQIDQTDTLTYAIILSKRSNVGRNFPNYLHSENILQLQKITPIIIGLFDKFWVETDVIYPGGYLTFAYERLFRSSLARYLVKESLIKKAQFSLQDRDVLNGHIHYTFYEVMLKNMGTSMEDVLDYYSWLIFTQRKDRFEDGYNFLQGLQSYLGYPMPVTNVTKFDSGEVITYQMKARFDHYMIHDPLLSMELAAVGLIRVPSKIYLYYLLVARAVLLQGWESRSAKQSVNDMKQVCNEFVGGTMGSKIRYAALGHGCMYEGNYQKVASFLYRSLLLGNRFDLTVEHICLCFEFLLGELWCSLKC